MPNSKSHIPDSKNNVMACELRNINSDSRMNRPESKSMIFDWKHSHSDLKHIPDSKTNNNADHASSQGDASGGDGIGMPPSFAPETHYSHNGNKVYKSGPLFLSSKGIGWTSWKKRWFILTETSLVFFRSDPNVASQKGGEANLTLGGIDLNSSGSVVVKADKKLLIVSFPDGRDGRAFTLKAETSEDLYGWKDALEAALSDAPSAGNSVTKTDTADASQEQPKEQTPTKSSVLGRPILLALEDIDGTPSFLEKALCYVEDFGVNVEGILRQAADVDDVERRIREYEQGKVEFTEDEDGHVIGDCIKYVLRELPSPPVPASCCAALLEAYKSERGTRVSAMRAAICDTFPEPNRRLLQRILIMMEAVAENKGVNRMSVSAVAACMSPLLLRPLLAGEVELGNGSEIEGDSVQLLQAAAAANHAQAICITLVEEYDKIFGEEDMLSDLYSDSDEYGSETGSDEYYEEDEYSDDDDVENFTDGSCSCDEESDHGSSSGYSESVDDDDLSKGSVCSITISKDDPKARRIRRRTNVKKGSPLESIALITDQQAEIVRLEANKAKLKERIESEARRNTILKEDLVSKKKALEMRRVALLEELSRLEEELQKAPLLASTDEKTNADPNNNDQSEANDPGLQHNQLSEQNSNDPGLQQKDKDLESATTCQRNKDSHSTKEPSEKRHFHSHPSKHHERGLNKSTSSRRLRAEAANTTSALSKITNRLTFLKERRNQIAEDLQDNDKDHKSQPQ